MTVASPALHVDPRLRVRLQAVVAALFVPLAMVTFPRLVDLHLAGWLAAVAVTASLGWSLAVVAIAPPISRALAIFRVVVLGAAFGVLDVPVAFVAAQLATKFDLRAVLAIPIVTLLGSPFGLVLGLLYGLVAVVPVVLWHGVRLRPSAESGERALAVAAMWLVMIAIGAAVLGDSRHALLGTGASRVDPWRGLVIAVTACSLAAAGAAIATVSVAKAISRRRFIARVVRSDEPMWAIIEPPLGVDLHGLPCLGAARERCDHVLARCERSGEGVYRGCEAQSPMAWVPRRWLG